MAHEHPIHVEFTVGVQCGHDNLGARAARPRRHPSAAASTAVRGACGRRAACGAMRPWATSRSIPRSKVRTDATSRSSVARLGDLGSERRLRRGDRAARGGRRDRLAPAGELCVSLSERRRVRPRRSDRHDPARDQARRVPARLDDPARAAHSRGAGLGGRRRSAGPRARRRADARRFRARTSCKSIEELVAPPSSASQRHRFWDNLESRPINWVPWPERTPGPPVWREWYRFRPRATFDDPFTDAARSAAADRYDVVAGGLPALRAGLRLRGAEPGRDRPVPPLGADVATGCSATRAPRSPSTA